MAENSPLVTVHPDPGVSQTGPENRLDRAHYQVVARRYRPQLFDELVGQEHVARALRNAVTTGRVGHAYLFTGARGVGKTSAARILAKALNCEKGPTADPCNVCSICQDIAAGSDIDVLEVDGASNRGIEEVRALRQNATLRPSRARYRVYIIDEVHMLTREAFNALLKTLEEPPPHVKFILCTTEPNKVPPTILSRCQRFDFSGISPEAICRRLSQILEKEGIQAEPEAINLIARRAGGSMRDAQSLLEQVLAFGGGSVTVETVRQLLGLAADEAIHRIVTGIAEGQPGAVLRELEQALAQGMDLVVFMEQLAGYIRDLMVVAAGCGQELLLYTSKVDLPELRRLADRFGLETLLAALQLLDHTLNRMRFSFQPRLVAELGLIRLARLQHLVDLASFLWELQNRETSFASEPAARGTELGPRQASRIISGVASSPAPPVTRTAGVEQDESQVLAEPSAGGRQEASAEPGQEAITCPDPTGEIVAALKHALAEAKQPASGASQLSSQETHPAPRETFQAVDSPAPTSCRPPEESSFPEKQAGKAASSLLPRSRSDSKAPPVAGSSSSSRAVPDIDLPDPTRLWQEALNRVGGYLAAMASQFAAVAWKNPSCLEVTFPASAVASRVACEKQVQRFERVLAQLVGRKIQVRTAVAENSEANTEPQMGTCVAQTSPRAAGASNWRSHPLVQKAAELFDAVPLNPEFPARNRSEGCGEQGEIGL